MNISKKQAGKSSAKARKPELVFEDKFYKIEKIPLNYRIIIKKTLESKIPNFGIDREYYSSLDSSVEEAHEVAKYEIEQHFKPCTKHKGHFSPGI